MKLFAAFLLGVSLLVALAGASAGRNLLVMSGAQATASPSASPSASPTPYGLPSVVPTATM